MRDIEGHVLLFRIHDALHDLAVRVAEEEESFYCRAHKHLTALNENEFSECTQIFLNMNKLSSLPNS
jgi:hypothetical protein